MRLKHLLTCCSSFVALTGAAHAQQVSSPANAQSPAAPQIPSEQTPENSADIVVTASKSTAQTVLQAPIAIQAFSGAELAAKNIRSVDTLIAAVPGAAQGEQLGEFLRTYSIRGSGTGGGIGDSLIGYYLDDTPYIIPNAQFAPQIRLIDLDRVEVLRGPYGTLYGAGAMGGTIIFHTKDPSLTRITADAEGYVGTTQGAHLPNYGTAGAISIPIIQDKLGIRISGGGNYRAGYADVYAGDPAGTPRVRDANDSKHRDLRIVALWQPSSELSVRLQYQHFDGRQGFSQQMTSLKPHYFANYGNIDGFEKSNNNLYSGTINLDLGFANFVSSTGYIDFNTGYLTSLNIPLLGGNGRLSNDYIGHSFSQEVRLTSAGASPLHWVIGGFYNDAKNAFGQTIDFPVPLLNGVGTTTTRTKNYSGFGEVSYDLDDGKIVPLGGIRVYHDDRNFVSVNATSPTVTGSSSPTVVTWRGNLSYHPNRSMTVFFNAGTGFRSGIVQSQLQADALALDGINQGTSLSPDRMRNLELGFKGALRASRVNYELNLYDLRYTDIQSGLVTSIQLAAFASLGNAKIQGIDASLQWQPIDGLTLGVSGDVNKSEYTSVNPIVARGVGPTVAEGKRLLNQPRWTARFDIGYSTAIGNDTTVFTNGSGSFSDNRLNQFGDATAKTAIFDASVGVRKDNVEIEVFGQNLSNERGPWFIRQAANPTLIGGPIPRTIGLRARLHYK